MNKELEAFERIKKMYIYFINHYRELEPFLMICEEEDLNTIETALKEYKKLKKEVEMEHALRIRLANIIYEKSRVLEIIKNKISWNFAIKYWWENHEINDEEYDLLKDYFKNEREVKKDD